MKKGIQIKVVSKDKDRPQRVWMGTEEDYKKLPQSTKEDSNILFAIIDRL